MTLFCPVDVIGEVAQDRISVIQSSTTQNPGRKTIMMTAGGGSNSATSSARLALDQLFAFDAIASMGFGVIALIIPHFLVEKLFLSSTNEKDGNYTGYNHSVHEMVRLYACLRLACGWMLWNIRQVDDGMFRRHVCEGLLVCYVLQALTVLRAQFTDRRTIILNWIAIIILLLLSAAYGSFRFRKGGNLIKIYELPTSSALR